MTTQDLEEVRRDLLAVAYNQIAMELAIYQRGLRLNASVCVHRPKAERRKSSLTAFKAQRLSQNNEENMLSAKMLNDIKLDKELDTLVGIFERACEELTNNEGNSKSNENLFAAIEAMKAAKNEEEKLLEQLHETQAAHKSLKAQIESSRLASEQRIEIENERVATLRHSLRHVRRVNDLEYDLVVRWEENRCTQATIACQNEERELLQRIIEFKQRLSGEQRIIREVENFSATQLKELRAQIAEWQQKYTDEMQRKHSQIQQSQQRITELRNSHEQHQQVYEERSQFVQEYLELKAEQQRLYEQQMYRVECAVRLQAWWRGVMVRQGFGPFRKKSKKGKKGKGK